MTLFDVLFIALFLVSVVTLLSAAVLVLRGRGARALRILRAWAIGAAVYLAVVALTRYSRAGYGPWAIRSAPTAVGSR